MDVFVPMNQSASFVYPLVYPTLNGYYSMFVPTPVQKQYEDFIVYEQHILSDLRTTIYVRHIPNKYTLKMLEEEIDRTHKNRYNFLHLPFDYEVLFHKYRTIAIEDMHSLISRRERTWGAFMRRITVRNGEASSLRK